MSDRWKRVKVQFGIVDVLIYIFTVSRIFHMPICLKTYIEKAIKLSGMTTCKKINK